MDFSQMMSWWTRTELINTLLYSQRNPSRTCMAGAPTFMQLLARAQLRSWLTFDDFEGKLSNFGKLGLLLCRVRVHRIHRHMA